jgi:hypothetical protein
LNRNYGTSFGSGSKNQNRTKQKGTADLLPTLTETLKGSNCGGAAAPSSPQLGLRDNRPTGVFSSQCRQQIQFITFLGKKKGQIVRDASNCPCCVA